MTEDIPVARSLEPPRRGGDWRRLGVAGRAGLGDVPAGRSLGVDQVHVVH